MQEPGQTLSVEDANAEITRWLNWQSIYDEFTRERQAQLAQWGDQPLPLGFGDPIYQTIANQVRRECDEANERGEVTHRHVLLEEFYEALAEGDYQKARDELIQVGACVVKAIEDIDRNFGQVAGA